MSAATMDAGRELDALVAEKVMGWTVNRSDGRHWHTVAPKGGTNPHRLVGTDCCAMKYSGGDFCPSVSIAAAWEVVEKLRVDGFRVFIDMGNGIEVMMERDGAFVVECESITVPSAICRAALEAVR